jgi:NAD-dependent SIR2 family protein deacetylase
MSIKIIECDYCYNQSTIEYKSDEDEPLTPTYCPFCGQRDIDFDEINDDIDYYRDDDD